MTAKKLKVSPSNSWQNRSRLVVFGDSLADIGNAVDPLTGQSLRQSDGLVLVEALLEDFGIAADSSIPAFFGTPPTGFKSPLNYAFVGATTGEDGSEAVGLGVCRSVCSPRWSGSRRPTAEGMRTRIARGRMR